jgi:hypothetical protein
MRRQRAFDDSTPCFRFGAGDALAKGAHSRALRQRAHEVHHRVHETPGEVAPQRRHHDCPDVVAPGGGNRNRADDGDRHDEAEQDLRDAIERIEQRPAFLPWSISIDASRPRDE